MVRIQTNLFSGALLWAFLPRTITNFLQARYYEWKYAPQSPARPRPGSKKHKRDYNIIHIIVILLYISYNFYESIYSTPKAPNYYKTLGVTRDFTTQQLKSNYRKLSLKYHPDKQEPGNYKAAQEKYIFIRMAYEVLQNPVQLTAYEKFGPTALDCKSCKTERDYLYYMIPAYIMHHAMTGLMLFIFFVLFGKGYGRYWRFLIYFGTAAFEANILLTNNDPISFILPSLLVFEKIEIIRQMNVTFFIAMSHIGPSLFPERNRDIRAGLQQLNKLNQALDQQSCIQFVQGYEPFANSPDMMNLLQQRMGKLTTDMRLFKFQEMQQVINNIRKSQSKASSTTTNNNYNVHPNDHSNHDNDGNVARKRK